MPVLWGIIVMVAMYIVAPVAIIGGTLVLLGGGDRRRRASEGSANQRDVVDPRHPPSSGR